MENTRLTPTHVSHITTSQQLLLTQFILQTPNEISSRNFPDQSIL